MQAKPGDRVKVTAKDEIKEGILMPNEETGSVIIKLDNGYNIGIDGKKVKEIKILPFVWEKTCQKMLLQIHAFQIYNLHIYQI